MPDISGEPPSMMTESEAAYWAQDRPDEPSGVLAIVGSVSLEGNAEAAAIIERVLDEFNPAVVISGGAIGIDQMAVAAAKRRGIATREFLPKTRRWADGFKPRNLLIAQQCTALVRIVDSRSKTYGSGWTRDRAAEMGKYTENHVIVTDGPHRPEGLVESGQLPAEHDGGGYAPAG